MRKEKNFPNGFESWAETHHLIVESITLIMSQDFYPEKLEEIQIERGTGGIWELCIDLADQFEELNQDREWDGEFFDEIELFINKNLGV